jgi:hypothetical protein
MALQLIPRYLPETIIEGVLWRLGETEFRRKRHTLLFGRRLVESAEAVSEKLAELVVPGAEVIITASDTTALLQSAMGDRLAVPLRAVAHMKRPVSSLKIWMPILPELGLSLALMKLHCG